MKTVAIHQPNYLPWGGFFFKMMMCDVFVILDNVQYAKNSLINRNKIKGSQGEILLTVPVTTSSETIISDVKVAHPKNLTKHVKALQANYAKAPYFGDYFPVLTDLLLASEHKLYLAAMNEALIRQIAFWLKIECKIVRSSDHAISSTSDKRLVDLVQAEGGTHYLSGNGGRNYQSEDTYTRAGIELVYTNYTGVEYPQLWGDFVPNLSILDMLFNCGPEAAQLVRSATKEI